MFSSSDLSNMRSAQEAHMMDRCNLLRSAVAFEGRGSPKRDLIADTAETACGLDMRPGSERRGGQMTVVQYDATVRLPIATDMTGVRGVRIVSRFGEALSTPLDYEFAGPVQRGPSGLRVMLKRIEI